MTFDSSCSVSPPPEMPAPELPRGLKVARAIFDRGFVPVALRDKIPFQRGWPDLRPNPYEAPEAFMRATGAGVHLGASGLVDLEADCLAADLFLWGRDEVDGEAPPTGCRWQSPSGRRHGIYALADVGRKVAWSIPDADLSAGVKGTLVELRSGNHQSVFPGSTHPSGGEYTWVFDEDPWPVDYSELQKAASLAATAGALAHYYPPEGVRHHTILALAGYLRHHGVEREAAWMIVWAAGTAVGDDELDDRLQCVVSTYARTDNVTGLPTLREHAPKLAAWLQTQFEPTVSREDGPSSPGALPRINAADQDLRRVTELAWDAIKRRNDPPLLFLRGGLPHRLEPGPEGPVLRRLNKDRMRHEVARSADWFREKGGKRSPAIPPAAVIEDMLATPQPPLPVLIRFVAAPVFSSTGTFETAPGYHAASLTYYAPGREFSVPQVAALPTERDVQWAVQWLRDELLGEFPFTGDAERAHAIGLLLLPFARELIDGPTPLHLVEKPTPGTGASLLTGILTLPSQGKPISAMAEVGSDDEWRKQITAHLYEGSSVLLIDNVRRELRSPALAVALTAPIWQDRLLSTSETVHLPVRCTWIATGNNPTLSDEIKRRTVRIRLDARVDSPWLRTGFRHPNLSAWASENRGALVWSALTLIQAWIAAGRPAGAGIRLGMFESWSDVLGGILSHAGIPGFLGNLKGFYDDSDAGSAAERLFVMQWYRAHQNAAVGVADLLPLALDLDPGLPLGDGNDRAQRTKLGIILTKLRDRRFTLASPDCQFCVTVTNGGVVHSSQRWYLQGQRPYAETRRPPARRRSPFCFRPVILEIRDLMLR